MLAEDDVLNVDDGRLASPDPLSHLSMSRILIAADAGDAAIGTKGVSVPLQGRGGERYVAHALPLTSGGRNSFGTVTDASVALFVRKATFEMPNLPEVIAKTYQLTPTELRVLLAITEIGGVPDVAEALGIADSTVRTHLTRLFDKTGATRQADLVRLVAGFSTPFAK